jgi:hypothetical protein
MLAGLSPDVRQFLYKQVSEAKRNQADTIPTQPPSGHESRADAGPGPSTAGQRSRTSEALEGQLAMDEGRFAESC